MENLAKSFQIV